MSSCKATQPLRTSLAPYRVPAAQIATTYILSPTSSKPLCVIKYAPGNPPKYHPPVGYGFTGIALSPDGGQIAISTESGVSVFRCDNGQQLYEYRDFKHKSCNPRWSPDGRYIAAADGVHSESFPSEVHVWNAQSGACVAKFVSAWQANPQLNWLPDNHLFAVPGESGISFYDLEKGTGTPVCDLPFKDLMLFSWSSNAKVAAVFDSCKHPGLVELRDLLMDRVTKQIRLGELRNVMQRGTCSLKWSPDGSELAMLHFGGPLAFWKF
jgi:WD40 repeat protein